MLCKVLIQFTFCSSHHVMFLPPLRPSFLPPSLPSPPLPKGTMQWARHVLV